MKFRYFPLFLFVILALFFSTTSCQEDTSTSAAERIAAENALFLDFLKQNYDAYYDAAAVVTIDGKEVKRVFGSKDSVDLVYWEEKTGVGDTITSQQTVGYRYKLYSIAYGDSYLADSVTIKIDKTEEKNNYDDSYPTVVVIDQVGYNGLFFGVNEALQHMKLNGKAWIFMPSSQTNNNYYSQFYEIEVVYVSR